MRWYGRAIIVALLLAAVHGGRSGAASSNGAAVSRPPQDDDESFIYDAVTRFNESLVGTIDAIDSALATILAGDVAVFVFIIDKIAELRRPFEAAAIGFLAGSILLAVTGYVLRFGGRPGIPDGVRPRRFIADLAKQRHEAIIGALEQMIAAGERNLRLRSVKRVLAACSVLLVLAGLVLVLVARVRSGVIR